MRDLNNEASKRCREKGKQKLATLTTNATTNAGNPDNKCINKFIPTLTTEESIERERNNDLRMKVRLLEEQVKRVKDAILHAIVPGSNRFLPVSNH